MLLPGKMAGISEDPSGEPAKESFRIRNNRLYPKEINTKTSLKIHEGRERTEEEYKERCNPQRGKLH